MSHGAEFFRRGILHCCLHLGYREGLDKREVGNQDIPSKIFCHTVPKSYVGESFSVALSLGSEKVWIGGRGEDQYFPSTIFCDTVPKIYLRESFCVALNSGSEKVWIRVGGEGVSRFSIENFLSHSPETFRRGILYWCSISGYRKSFDMRGGEYQDIPLKTFVSQCGKFLYGKPLLLPYFRSPRRFG